MAITAQMQKIHRAIQSYYKTIGVDVPKLKGRGHWERVMILPWLAKYIPDELKDSMYFTGQGQLPIIPKSLATHIGKKLEIPFNLFAVEV